MCAEQQPTSLQKSDKKTSPFIALPANDKGKAKVIDPPISTTVPKENDKKLKVVDKEATHVITGYSPLSKEFVQDILIYDIPAKWNNFKLLTYLST